MNDPINAVRYKAALSVIGNTDTLFEIRQQAVLMHPEPSERFNALLAISCAMVAAIKQASLR